MKKIILLLLIAWLLLPVPLLGQSGTYNTWTGLIWCNRSIPWACPHEVAHKVDDSMGFPSRSAEFREAAESIGLVFWNTPVEVYAELYTIAQGKEENMPEALREFYDWELAEKLLKDYE